METSLVSKLPSRSQSGVLVLPLSQISHWSESIRAVDHAADGAIRRAVKRGDARTTRGHVLVLHELLGSNFNRVMLVGTGEAESLDERDYRKLCAGLGDALCRLPLKSAWITLPHELKVANRDVTWRYYQLTLAICAAAYRFTLHKSGKQANQPTLAQLSLLVSPAQRRLLGETLARARAVADAVALTKDLGNTAPNVCTPAYLADSARELAAASRKLSVKVVGEAAMRKLGMGAFLAVTSGSRQPAQLIILNYRGAPDSLAPLALIGKGVTFDTGGISIKSSQSMDEMKFDMCGAAAVLGVLRAVSVLELPINIIGLVAAAENMPDGNASRPGDVVTTLAGKTVEILNTDAEGRMLLADTLTYALRYRPAALIDVATLTGAAVTALGKVASALFSNDRQLGDALFEAGARSGDLTWQMPLFEDYHTQLESPFADLANIGGRAAGAITAACFLSDFAADCRWAHLDIAGVATNSGEHKGATGRPVPLLMEFIFRHLEQSASGDHDEPS